MDVEIDVIGLGDSLAGDLYRYRGSEEKLRGTAPGFRRADFKTSSSRESRSLLHGF